MLNKILRWLARKDFIKLKIIVDNKLCYCPLCLSDVEVKSEDPSTTCRSCAAKLAA